MRGGHIEEPEITAHGDIAMKHVFACIIAIVGWYLLYPPATHKGDPDSYMSLSK
jgi:hypothetical protein